MAQGISNSNLLSHPHEHAAQGTDPLHKLRLFIEYGKPEDLTPDPKNPRKHSKKQLRQIAQSLETFGFIIPVVVDKEGNIVVGNARVAASILIGISEIPTIRIDHLGENQMRALKIADNRLAECATWDEQLLAGELEILANADLDFDIEVIGFDVGEIEERIEIAKMAPEAKPDAADVVPFRSGPIVTKLGDLWALDDHSIYCGSATLEGSFMALMRDQLAAMVITDPPYNVPIDGHVTGLGATRHREFAMASGEMTTAQFSDFLLTFCTHLVRFSAVGSLHCVFMDWRHVGQLIEAGGKAYTELKNFCVWVKDNAGMGSLYRSQHELALVFKSGHAPHRNNVQLGKYGRNRSNVWRYAGANSFSRQTDEGNLLSLHPTVKPVAMIADAILDCTARRDLVLDCFMGSGTTLMACERTHRRCAGIEIDPAYVDTAILRWQAFTGGQAVHVQSGQTFNQVRATLEANHAA